jgi:hypothetical protein
MSASRTEEIGSSPSAEPQPESFRPAPSPVSPYDPGSLNSIKGRQNVKSSSTWTSANADVGIGSDEEDQVDERDVVVQQYNELAAKV